MSSTIRELYFTNTDGSHNKDYRITWNVSMNQVAVAWGKIGGAKQGGTEAFNSYTAAAAFVAEKTTRRIEHGYTLVSDLSSIDAETVGGVVGKHEFDADIREMQRIS